MPTYEKCGADGTVLERTTTFTDHPNGYDKQMAEAAADDATPWRVADDFPAEAHSDPNPGLAAAPDQPPAAPATSGLIAAPTPQSFAHDDHQEA